jgi:hypothetical protein
MMSYPSDLTEVEWKKIKHPLARVLFSDELSIQRNSAFIQSITDIYQQPFRLVEARTHYHLACRAATDNIALCGPTFSG